MRADEFLVERYIDMEKRCNTLNKELEQSSEREEAMAEELADYEQFTHILQKHVKVHSYGVEIYFSTSREEDVHDLDYVKSFLNFNNPEKGEE